MSKANVAVQTPETRGFENKVDEDAFKAKDAVNVNSPEAQEIGRAEEEGMCHPTGPGKSHASN